MNETKIEKGVPMPVTNRYASLPWQQMEVGDSIVVDFKNPQNAASQACARYAPKQFRAATKYKVSRIWRVA